MYTIIRSTTMNGSREQQRPSIIDKGDFKSLIISNMCDEVASALTPDASLYARKPDGHEERVTPADNVYGMLAAIDRGCNHLVVDVPGKYGVQPYRIHFVIDEI